MNKITLLLLLVLCNAAVIHGQADSTGLLKEAQAKLGQKGATVSMVLEEKKFLPIHPLPAFRELIKQHARTGSVSITPEGEPGDHILVNGTVSNANGPLKNVLVYLYQTDHRGWYAASQPHVGGNEGDRRHARLFGYVLTDNTGRFQLETIKPSGYPNSDLPAHIHIEIFRDGIALKISELLFDDDPRLKGAIRERAVNEGFIIAKPEVAKEYSQQFSYVIPAGND